MAAIADIQK